MMPWKSFAQIRRQGGRPHGWWAIVLAGSLSALCLPLLIFVLGLIVELFVSRGDVPEDQRQLVREWTAEVSIPSEETRDLHGRGLLPLVYRNRNVPLVGSFLTRQFATWPALRSNYTCLIFLICSGCILAAIESLVLAILYRSVERGAINATSQLRGLVYAQAFKLGTSNLLGGQGPRPDKLFVEELEQVRAGLVTWWRAVPRSVVTLVLLVGVSLVVNIWLTITAVVFAALTWLLYQGLKNRARNLARHARDDARDENGRLVARLQQVPLVTGYSIEKLPGEPIEELLQRHEAASFRERGSDASVTPIVLFFVLVGAGLILFLIGINILRAQPSLTLTGTTILAVSLLTAWFPLARLWRTRKTMALADAASASVLHYLQRDPPVLQATEAQQLPSLQQHLRMESIMLGGRNGKRFIDDLNVDIPAKGKFAFVSSDSQGPLALAGMMVRLHDPAAGRILFDNTDIRVATLDSLRKQAVLVGGDGMIFDGTVSQNISCGDESYSQLQIVDSAKQARAYNFIQELPHGFATPLGNGGTRLAPGEAFRLGLARAVLREPSVIVIQEPEEDLDEVSSGHIDNAFRDLASSRTLIILPTRITTLRSADCIFLLHEGKLIARGTHADLLQHSELYRHLNYMQFNPFRER